MTKRSTKRALLMSVLALLVCASMLVGTTFAWFTDSVTSAGNKIQSGTLKIDLEMLEVDGTWTSIKDSAKPIFDYDKWEPGYTDTTVLKVVNEGTLGLKWYAKFVRNGGTVTALADVIDVYVNTSATELPATRDLTGYTKVGTLAQFIDTIETTTYGSLLPAGQAGDTAYLGIVLKMQETAGNEYQNMSLIEGADGFDIQILATQLMYEKDSFNEKYDEEAEYAYGSSAVAGNATGVTIEVRDNHNKQYKVASFEVPAAAIADADKPVNVIIEPSVYEANITINADQETLVYEVTVENVKEGNTTPIIARVKLPAGLAPATVAVYHYDDAVVSTYDPVDGYVTFEVTEFSPFTFVYDAESKYDAPETDDVALPEAKVTRFTETNNIEWGNYGQWSPTEGLEANLDAAYTFACTEDADEVAASPYANWFCDFYVSLDKELGENEIFLGGNYGTFGWIGFHNGDVTLAANQELGLLESVTTNPWSYQDIANFVGEFICGVGDVDGALAAKGATFTVALRLTNPENTSEKYDVAKITYNFATGVSTETIGVSTGQGIQDAINNGADEIVLNGDIDLSQGITIPGLN